VKGTVAWAGIVVVGVGSALGLAAQTLPPSASDDLAQQVRETEIAFAKTMADRDLEAFARFVAEDAVFIGGQGPLRGREAIVEGWRTRYQGPKAPFSWTPEIVEVVGSGDLAISRGPVFDPDGKRVGTYISTWRREPSGRWLIVIDSGCPACPE